MHHERYIRYNYDIFMCYNGLKAPHLSFNSESQRSFSARARRLFSSMFRIFAAFADAICARIGVFIPVFTADVRGVFNLFKVFSIQRQELSEKRGVGDAREACAFPSIGEQTRSCS